jgi:hypothetical protein
METQVQKQQKNDVITHTIVEALDEVRKAVVREHDAGQRLLETMVKLCISCHEAEVRLTGSEVHERTGASPTYYSQVRQATEKAIAKRKLPLQEAGKLGFRGYVKRFHVAQQRKKRSVAELPEVGPNPADTRELFDAFQRLILDKLPKMPTELREELSDQLLDLGMEIRRTIPGRVVRQEPQRLHA